MNQSVLWRSMVDWKVLYSRRNGFRTNWVIQC